jgi:hypothetical protein
MRETFKPSLKTDILGFEIMLSMQILAKGWLFFSKLHSKVF